ncbi:hypothetical protein MRBLRC7O_000907 [Agrobacterium radiobacter]|uniref:hypothetical protein n=1 Tax=Agrobacterium radiobacter TaxID=362 RepID=UPI003465E573
MTEAVRLYLPWLLSCITIYMTVLAGNKSPKAWLFGLLNQALWLVWILTTGAWGLLPMNAALWVVYARNHLKWNSVASEQGFPVAPAKRVTPKDPQAVRPVEALRVGTDSTP